MRSAHRIGLFLLCGCLYAQDPLEPLTADIRVKVWATQAFWNSGVFFNAAAPAVTDQLADEPRECSRFGRNVAATELQGRNLSSAIA